MPNHFGVLSVWLSERLWRLGKRFCRQSERKFQNLKSFKDEGRGSGFLVLVFSRPKSFALSEIFSDIFLQFCFPNSQLLLFAGSSGQCSIIRRLRMAAVAVVLNNGPFTFCFYVEIYDFSSLCKFCSFRFFSSTTSPRPSAQQVIQHVASNPAHQVVSAIYQPAKNNCPVKKRKRSLAGELLSTGHW